ncbi:type I-C CRISPR-associated endonuclease Cas1c [Solibaculum mannosilyticum]|uniref:CRISPR-associated endonuclease Cas1 n=1 Tax=Solibaculum mannosilyticum TaxID=2780922 RepID=A0A7I8D5F0_9FIRM|nr:type I-C CRISPR-associated endonuclease Cas1c [Solibaculum mannosilyticum]BCI61022.1 CRISPR-associated endonuclease Cas1 [Solibaculum mannosilyticum]
MRILLNTLFVLSEDAYLSLDGENVVILKEEGPVSRFPLHTLEAILCFSYKGASPALMGACAQRNICLSFYSPRGKFYCQTAGQSLGNVLLRREQFRRADSPLACRDLAQFFLTGKLYNSRWVLERTIRDHALRVDVDRLKDVSRMLGSAIKSLQDQPNTDAMRGVEGAAASQYFSVFDHLILQNKSDFFFQGRSRRPPLDRMNAILSFVYTLLASDCAAALRGVGLDPYVGFLHTDRSGRASLALDLMEELRPVLGDRFALTLVNSRMIHPNQFELQDSGAVFLNEAGRKAVLSAWQEKKRDTLTHPFLREKIPWGLVPYLQALLLSRYLRGDLDAYPPFLWK